MPGVRQPAQLGARRELAPAHGEVAVQCEQAGRTVPPARQLLECGLVLLTGSAVVRGPQPPVHAPAPVRGARPAEEILESRPQVGGQRLGRKIHEVYYRSRPAVPAGGTNSYRRCRGVSCCLGVLPMDVGYSDTAE